MYSRLQALLNNAAAEIERLNTELAEAKRLRDDARNQWALCSEDRARVEAERDALRATRDPPTSPPTPGTSTPPQP